MSDTQTPHWNFFTNHAHVLICLARNPEQPLREVALSVGITERAVQRIVAELEDAGYIERERVGRQNRYFIHAEGRLRHPLEAHRSIGDLMDVVVPRAAKRYDLGGHGSEI
ncbi:MAG: winged helix-turn-helix domain-containing protein [Verrucomicrobiota bacterium]